MSYSAIILADAPIGYWQFNNTSSTTATDTQATFNGTYTGGFTLNSPGMLPDDAGVLLNGSTGVVTVPFNSALNASPLTWEGWVKVSDNTGYSCVFGTNGGSGITGLRLYVRLGRFEFQIGDGAATHNVSGIGFISTNTWSHCVVTYDGTSARVYQNAALITTQTFTYAPIVSGTLNFGRDASSSFLNGSLDEFAVYNKVLTPDQIATHFNAGAGHIKNALSNYQSASAGDGMSVSERIR